MAKKKVIGEDGKTYVMKEKKPIYKRVWFWILAVMILVAFASSLGGGDESASGGETIDNSSQSEKKQESEEKIEKSIDTTESTVVEIKEADTTKKETPEKEDVKVDESIPTEHKSALRSFEVPFSNCI